jgi:hypothetical protein
MLADLILELPCHLLNQVILCHTGPYLLILGITLDSKQLLLLLKFDLELLNLALIVQ